MTDKQAVKFGLKAIEKRMTVYAPNPGYEYEWFRIICKDFQEVINELCKSYAIDYDTLWWDSGNPDLSEEQAQKEFIKYLRKLWQKSNSNR